MGLTPHEIRDLSKSSPRPLFTAIQKFLSEYPDSTESDVHDHIFNDAPNLVRFYAPGRKSAAIHRNYEAVRGTP